MAPPFFKLLRGITGGFDVSQIYSLKNESEEQRFVGIVARANKLNCKQRRGKRQQLVSFTRVLDFVGLFNGL